MTIRESIIEMKQDKDRTEEGESFELTEVKNANRMGEAGLLFQLMEECSELSQACAKRLREMGYGQPLGDAGKPKIRWLLNDIRTGASIDLTGHRDNLLEEMADVSLVIDEILVKQAFDSPRSRSTAFNVYSLLLEYINGIQSKKLKRTAKRYKEHDNENNGKGQG